MLDNFTFSLPTKIYFGKDEENNVGNIINELGYKNVLVVYGMGSIEKSGLLQRVLKSLESKNIKYSFLSGIRSNPTIDKAKEGINILKNHNCDFILPIGGGSVIDVAKLIATGSKYDGDPFDISLKKYEPKDRIPFGCILTIAAAGSEMSNSCVIQDDALHIKAGYCSELNKPIFAIENPYLTLSVSDKQTTYGIIDMFTHSLERYLCKSNDDEVSDYLAEGVMRGIIDAGRNVKKDLQDIEARKSLMLLSSLSHNGMTSIGKKHQLTVHQLEHAVSGLYPEVAHGAGLSVLFPAFMEYYSNIDIDKFDKLAKNVFNSFLKDKKENAKMCAIKLKEFFKEMDGPLSFKDLGIENPDIDTLTKLVTKNGTRMVDHHIKPLDENVIKEIYNLANRR